MSKRITHLDTVRGAAVLGILVMNSVSFAFGNVGYFNISVPESAFALDQAAGVFGEVFADQKFMALFSLLFGASLLLFLDRVAERTEHPVRLSLWRNALLLAMGVLHAAVWIGDVLLVYAVCAPVLLLFRNASARALTSLGVGVFWLSLGFGWLMGGLDDASIEAVWTGSINTSAEFKAAFLLLCDVFSRAMGMMLLGMGLYKSGFLRRPLPPGGLGKSVAAIAVGAALSGVGIFWVSWQGFNASVIVRGNMLNGLATIPMALGYLGLLMAWDQRAANAWLNRVRSLGKMALTNYLGQTAVGLVLVALLPAEWFTRSTLWIGIVLVWVVQLLASEAWLKSFRMGPMEWLWRCATYRRWEPIRREPRPHLGVN